MTTTHMLKSDEADIAYDVHGPLPTADGRPPLFMIGQPMTDLPRFWWSPGSGLGRSCC